MAKQVIGTLSLTTAIYKLGKGVADSITDWADYADTMRLSAEMAGITTEEMSRLTQAADDFRVPMETMQRSMEMALKNGFIPTIDNLAALSDRLLAIDDPALRAAEASKIFGKSYADMMPFLLAGGEAIRDVTDGISDSLVVTAEAAQQAKEYKDALDALGDAWVGLKNKIGQFAVPALTDVINNLAGQPTELMKMQDTVLAAAKEAFDNQKISAGEYQSILDNVSTSTGTYTEYVSKLNFMLGILNKTNGDAAESTEGLSEAELEAANAAIAAAEAQAKMKAEFEDITSLSASYGDIISLAENYTSLLEEKENLAIERKKLINQGWSEESQRVKDLDADIAAVGDEMDNLANKMTLDMFAASIAIGGVTDGEMQAYFDMAVNMGVISREAANMAYQAWLDAKAEVEGNPINAQFTADNTEAMETIDELKAALRGIERNIGITVSVNQMGQISNRPITEGTRASGGDVIGGTPYIVGERGPELFVPNANGQIIPNNELSDYATGAVINNYNLTMPTTARAEDVRMAFELMEAWNR
jgi:hypothetical protein